MLYNIIVDMWLPSILSMITIVVMLNKNNQ
jgi:hypothetical protein